MFSENGKQSWLRTSQSDLEAGVDLSDMESAGECHALYQVALLAEMPEIRRMEIPV